MIEALSVYVKQCLLLNLRTVVYDLPKCRNPVRETRTKFANRPVTTKHHTVLTKSIQAGIDCWSKWFCIPTRFYT